MNIKNRKKQEWWNEEYGFFGNFYMEGDNSKNGYRIAEKQNLEERTLKEVNGVIKLLNLESNSKILDCPTGYGRHAIKLAEYGYDVVGSDLNSKHLDKAKEKINNTNLKIRFVKENMIDLKYNTEFDAVINMFYSFGFFESDEDNFKVLKNFYNALKPGGKFLMHTDVNIPFIEAGKYKHNEIRELVNGNKLQIVDKYDSVRKRINGIWILRDKTGNEIRKEYSVRVYTKEEFIGLCKKVGFKSFEVYSDWDKKLYSENSEDMIIIATK